MKHFNLLFDYLRFPVLFLMQFFSLQHTKKLMGVLLFATLPLHIHAAEYSCLGETITDLDGATSDISVSESNAQTSSDITQYLKFQTGVDGELRVRLDRHNYTQRFKISDDQCNGNKVFNTKSRNNEDFTINISKDKIYYIKLKEKNNDDKLYFDLQLDFTAAKTPVCVESLLYTTSGDTPLTSCFDVDGIFVGGSGCKQLIKFRNLSSESVTNTDIEVYYGNDGNHCGIDGIDQTNSDCNVSTGMSYFKPLGDFTELETHTTFIEGAGPSIANTDPDIFMHYTIDGVTAYAKVEKCVIEDAYEANDMCIAETKSIRNGLGLCIDFGEFFSGGAATGGCEKQITIRNQSDTNLTDVSTQFVTDALFEGHFINDCGTDGVSGNCTDSNMMDFGFMDMNMFQ
jgi:hypothetical protein